MEKPSFDDALLIAFDFLSTMEKALSNSGPTNRLSDMLAGEWVLQEDQTAIRRTVHILAKMIVENDKGTE